MVEVVKPVRKKLPIKIEAASTLNAKDSSMLASEVNGIVVKWYVKENQKIKKGAPILKIDSTNYELQMNQAVAGLRALQSQYSSLEKDYERIKRLVEKEALPQQKLDEFEGQFDALKSQIIASKEGVAIMKRMVAKTIVRAPYSGIITERKVKRGEFVAAGAKSVASIIKSDILEAKISISEMFYSKIDKKSNIKFEIPSLNKSITGEITSKSKDIDNMKQFRLTVDVDNSKFEIPAGIYAVAEITSDVKERIILPNSSLKQLGNNKVEVFTVDKSGTVKSIRLISGTIFEDGIEVTGNIPEFVIRDISNVIPGEKVKYTLN
jgi:RND family efflux transporter MFP subunit